MLFKTEIRNPITLEWNQTDLIAAKDIESARKEAKKKASQMLIDPNQVKVSIVK